MANDKNETDSLDNRIASPMARMRDINVQEAASIHVDGTTEGSMDSKSTMSPSQQQLPPKSAKELKQEKNWNWKQKIARKGREERRSLNDDDHDDENDTDNDGNIDDNTLGSRNSTNKKSVGGDNLVMSCGVLEKVNGTNSIFKRLTQCGIGDDGAASEYEEYSVLDYYSDYGSSAGADTRSEYGSSVGNTGKFYSCYDDDDAATDNYDDDGNNNNNNGDDGDEDEQQCELSPRLSSRWKLQEKQQQTRLRRGRSRENKHNQRYRESSLSSVSESSINRSVDTTVLVEELSTSFNSNNGEIVTSKEYENISSERTTDSLVLLQQQQQQKSSTRITSLSDVSFGSTLSTSAGQIIRQNHSYGSDSSDNNNNNNNSFMTGIQSTDSSSRYKNGNTNTTTTITNNNNNNNNTRIIHNNNSHNRSRDLDHSSIVLSDANHAQKRATTSSPSTTKNNSHHLSTNDIGTKLQPAQSKNGFQLLTSSDDVQAFIEEMVKEGQSTLWHQETSALTPATVVIRLKKGYRFLDGNYCAPRLIWTDHKNDHTYELDLFDIQSLDRANLLQLGNHFPYSIPGRCMCLHLKNTTSFIFETRSEKDAVRFVTCIRSIIARLAYNLVTANFGDDVCGCEDLLELGDLIDATTTYNNRLSIPGSSKTNRAVSSNNDRSRAMDDVTEHMIEKILQSTMI